MISILPPPPHHHQQQHYDCEHVVFKLVAIGKKRVGGRKKRSNSKTVLFYIYFLFGCCYEECNPYYQGENGNIYYPAIPVCVP
jgi:hypothetical protein